MNFSSIFGALLGIGIVAFGVLESGKDSSVFLNPHALLIVLGGTLAATLISFPMGSIGTLFKVLIRQLFKGSLKDHAEVLEQIVKLSKGHQQDPQYLAKNLNAIKNPFLREAIEMLVQGGIPAVQLEVILKRRALTHFRRYEEEAEIFKVMAKFPPAFGLLGTTLGMIALMQNLGSPESFKMIGPAMAIGLTATFYGIAVSNFFLIPMAENLMKLNREDEVLREMVIDAVRLLREHQHPIIVEEHLRSYFLPNERKKILRKSA